MLRSGSRPARDPVGDVVEGVADDRLRVGVLARQRVPVGHEVEAVVLVLQRDPVLQGAHQMAEVQLARSGACPTRRARFTASEQPRQEAARTAARSIDQRAREHQRVEHQEAVRPQRVEQPAPAARGSRPASTLPPSSGGTGIMLKTASSTLSEHGQLEQTPPAAATSRCRRSPARIDSTARDDRQHEVADRARPRPPA